MNAYVYIDSDNNGFTASIAGGSNYQPAGDLVSYSFYNNGSDSDTSGWNSVGTIFTGDSRSTVTLPAFTVPSARVFNKGNMQGANPCPHRTYINK